MKTKKITRAREEEESEEDEVTSKADLSDNGYSDYETYATTHKVLKTTKSKPALPEVLVKFMKNYRISNLPQLMQEENVQRMLIHFDFSRKIDFARNTGETLIPQPFVKGLNKERIVQIVSIGCPEWSLKGDTSLLVNMTGVVGTRHHDGKTAAFTLLSNKTSQTEELIYMMKNDSYVLRKKFPDITVENCENGVQPVIGKRQGEIVARHLPVDTDEHGEIICPLGYFTKQTLDDNGTPYQLTLNDGRKCIRMEEVIYQKWVETFKDIIRESHLRGDLRSFHLTVEPTATNAPFYASMLLEIFYVLL
jgi:hypothetical protein